MRHAFYEIYSHDDNIAFSRIIGNAYPFSELKGYDNTLIHSRTVNSTKVVIYDFYNKHSIEEREAICEIIYNRIVVQRGLVKRDNQGEKLAKGMDRNTSTLRPAGSPRAKERASKKRIQRSLKEFTWLDFK